MADADTGKELERIVTSIRKGHSVKLEDLLRVVRPDDDLTVRPEVVPLPKPLSDVERKAIGRLSLIYEGVVPTERRRLAGPELASLLRERRDLKVVEKAIRRRVEAIKHIVVNHMDVEAEEESDGPTTYTEDGHHIPEDAVRVGADGESEEFSWEPRQSKPVLTMADLERAEADGAITHKELLAFSDQIRVFNQSKLMAAVSKDPGILNRLRDYITPGSRSAALSVRKV